MKKYYTFLFSCLSYVVFGQGCSDAGFCTMGAMRPNQAFHKKLTIRLKSVEISQYVGRTKFEDKIWATTLDLNFALSNKTYVQFKLPYMLVQGPLATTQGIGDISLSLTHSLYATEKVQISASIGTKIPTNNANFKNTEGRALPMYYQSSLGTYDLILGISLITKKWLFATGLQHAFNAVDNQFTWGAWKSSEKTAFADIYPVSNQVKRGTDIMFRAERNFRFARFNFNIGILPIYRIIADSFVSPQSQTRLDVDETKGLALTILAGAGYRFSTKTGIKAMFGKQVATRYKNLDGLSREEVFTVGYEYRF